MPASVATSPTLLPHDQGVGSHLAQSPTKASAFANFHQLRTSGGDDHHAFDLGALKGLPPKHLDSADIEARRQEQADALRLHKEEQTAAIEEAAKTSAQTRHASDEPAASEPAVASAMAAAAAAAPDMDPQGPFEGPEKLLELWFADSPELLPSQALHASFTILQDADGAALADVAPRARVGLRAVPRLFWEEMLDIVKCKVLSVVEGDEVDAYLLSESSMFVFPHKIILKTCGTTTLLLGLQRLLELAKAALSGEACTASAASSADAQPYEAAEPALSAARKELGALVRQCFYSRKSFMFPERQKGPHKDWMLEVRLLDAFFDNGSAYTVGKMNGDHWLLYMCCPGDEERSVASPIPVERPLQLPAPATLDVTNDQTLEILMTHLAPESCRAFEFPADMPLPAQQQQAGGGTAPPDRGHLLGLDLSAKLGLADLFPHTDLDAFAFDPCGYSANAVIPASAGCSAGYWTIHVTPEEDSSYASFETNVTLGGAGVGGATASLLQGSANANANANANAKEGASPPLPPRDVAALIARVVDIFQPGKMSITLFTSSSSSQESGPDGKGTPDDGTLLHSLKLPGYTRKDRIAYEFENYDLIFCHFETKTRKLNKVAY